MGLSFSKSSVLYANSFVDLVFATSFLLGSFGVDIPTGPKEMLAGFDIKAVPGWKLLSRFSAAWLASFAFVQRNMSDVPTVQTAFDVWHVSMTLGALISREGFANDAQYYQTCALLGGFTIAGLVAKSATGGKND